MRSRERILLVSLILLILLNLTFCTTTKPPKVTTSDLKQAKVYVYEVQGIRIHTYMLPLPMGAGTSHIIETPNNLVMVDTVQNYAHNQELKAYVVGLGKPINRIYISHTHSHHWAGLEMFPGVPVYALQETIEEMNASGDEEMQKLRTRFGEEAIPYKKVVIPQNVVKPGEEIIDGVGFRFANPNPEVLGNVLFIAFPEQKAIIHHHLAYLGIHAPMFPIPPRVEMLQDLKKENYSWVIAGHGMPADVEDFVDQTTRYYQTALKVIEESPDPNVAKEKLIKEYTDYGGVFFLDIMLPRHYQK